MKSIPAGGEKRVHVVVFDDLFVMVNHGLGLKLLMNMNGFVMQNKQ